MTVVSVAPPAPSSHSATDWPVFGHEWAVTWLRKTLQPGGQGPRHAYLFLGPRQIGKSTLALAFAQALLCQQGGDVPCGRCRNCERMLKHGHVDFHHFQPVDKDGEPDRLNGTLRVEQAADIVRDASLSPMEARYRIFFLQNMERANAGFSNKILKTLEEPPASVILLLTAEDRSQLLPTIVSRCQVVELRPLATAEVRRMLEQQRGLDAAMADLLARYANGKPGWALEEAARAEPLKDRHDQLAQLWALLRSDLLMRLQLSESLAAAKGSKRLFALLAVWQTWWRDLMLVQAGVAGECTNQDALPELRLEAELISREDVSRYLGRISLAEEQLHRTVNVRLALDVLLLRLPRLPKDLPVAA